MARLRALPPTPRKTPRQSRATYTVRAIVDASVRVLIDIGLDRLTTTRVAHQAGLSVGALYQYFPNKSALLSACLEHHLSGVVQALERACRLHQGLPVADIATAVVGAFVDAQLSQRDAARALHAVTMEAEGAVIVHRLARRLRHTLIKTLKTAPDVQFESPELVTFMLGTALAGPVQAFITQGAPAHQIDTLRQQLTTMAVAYLQAVSSPRPGT